MQLKIKPLKRASYLVIFNLLMTMMVRGLFILELDLEANLTQKYVISIIFLNIDFFNSSLSFVQLNIVWVITIFLSILLFENDYKVPRTLIITELVILLFAFVLVNRYSPLSAPSLMIRLIQGFLLIIIYIGISLTIIFYKKRRLVIHSLTNLSNEPDALTFISKCPHCGTVFQSNPLYCYNCSKKIRNEYSK